MSVPPATGAGSSQPAGATKRYWAAQAIRQAILDGRYAPGERLFEEKLAAELGVSATPIREALLILEAKGLVRITPRRGATVIALGRADIEELYHVRGILEPAAVSMALERLSRNDLKRLVLDLQDTHEEMRQALRVQDTAPIPRLNMRFHFRIYEASGSRQMVEAIERLWNMLPSHSLRNIPHRSEWSFDQHQRLIDILDGDDPAQAAAAMRDHILLAAQSLIPHVP
ncbi:DNA-binding GntR family transcriptional regulator [Kibdelosporangium banguiense]|uniref:DNA-binding GntR family transcriptional regulator n=1 Tax=Kibdelosporangium banguiense TaxID=1365924 RepID=A0ABS4TXY8_9PSEU|nr:GntR family transcriptional regulator [Kibdelosporangium banguiense]MBP2329265.1 DNA-binding GntR family transcriptional regulator [Kibdelosporangium banguiense]